MNTPMNFRTRLATALLSLGLIAGTALAQPQYYQGPQGPPPPQQGWEAPPPQFAAAWQRGYRDGVYGARKDFENHRPPSPMNRDEYRNPHFIAPPDRRDYREGFRHGYQVAVRNIYGPRYQNY
jgi:hypothetical protein